MLMFCAVAVKFIIEEEAMLAPAWSTTRTWYWYESPVTRSEPLTSTLLVVEVLLVDARIDVNARKIIPWPRSHEHDADKWCMKKLMKSPKHRCNDCESFDHGTPLFAAAAAAVP